MEEEVKPVCNDVECSEENIENKEVEEAIEGEKLEKDEEEDVEDVAYEAVNKVDVLVDLLEKKGILNEGEFDEELEKWYDELSEEENVH